MMGPKSFNSFVHSLAYEEGYQRRDEGRKAINVGRKKA
jgi:hypothetical protein